MEGDRPPTDTSRSNVVRGRARGVPNIMEQQQQRIETLSLVNVSRGGHSPGGSSGESRHSGEEPGRGNGGNENGKGNGNGGSNRSPPGQRGTTRTATTSRSDFVSSRPDGMDSKKGTSGEPIDLMANSYKITRRPDPAGGPWRLYKYRVDFDPDDDNMRLKKGLVKGLQQTLGPNVCDGHLLYVSRPLAGELVLPNIIPVTSRQGNEFRISLRLVEQVNPTDPMYVVFYCNMIKKAQQMLNLVEMNRNYFDPQQTIKYPNRGLELWPGYVTVMRQHENDVLLCVEVTHKVLRTDSVLSLMSAIRQDFQGNPQAMQAAIEKQLIGKIVMTEYNRKTYRVDEIKWSARPTDTFPQRGVDVTFIDYYQQKYQQTITRPNQPLLASNPKARDIRRGMTGQHLLIPEFCRLTGLTEDLRSNFQLRRELGEHMFMVPERRVEQMNGLISRINANDAIRREFETWGIRIAPQPMQFPGRVMPKEKIFFGGQRGPEIPDAKADWTMAFRGREMVSCVPLKTWVVIVTERDSYDVENLIHTLRQVAGPLKFIMSPPKEIKKVRNPSAQAFLGAIEQAMHDYGSEMTMFFIILPNNKLDLYSAIKKRTYCEYGVPSQCFLQKNCKAKGLMSIATKVVIQMNAKLGGEPWNVEIPLQNMMVVGFDVYHGATDSRGRSVGAMSASMTKNCTRYFSTVSFHGNNEELSMNVCTDFTKCMTAYKKTNGQLPARIIFYRDGVGEGQLQFVYVTELLELKKAISLMYAESGKDEPTFTFIVVTKKINTRIMSLRQGRPENPPPGTVVDDVITLPERYDFFIVAQNVRQGTVSPTSYNVLWDNSKLGPDKIQRMTYKLCHMYYNWSGTVAVPSPVQYAHKLAFLTGTALGAEAHRDLSHLLYFL